MTDNGYPIPPYEPLREPAPDEVEVPSGVLKINRPVDAATLDAIRKAWLENGAGYPPGRVLVLGEHCEWRPI